jgi:hypothetical protein
MKNKFLANKGILIFLIAMMDASADAHCKLISKEQLENACVSPEAIKNLLKNELISYTKIDGYYSLNNRKVDQALAIPENKDMVEFLNYLKSLVGPDTQIIHKEPCMMTMGSQDIMMSK